MSKTRKVLMMGENIKHCANCKSFGMNKDGLFCEVYKDINCGLGRICADWRLLDSSLI